MLSEDQIKVIQQYFTDKGLYTAGVDGDAGAGTMQAAEQFLTSHSSDIKETWKNWDQKRKLVACIQLICKLHEIETGVIDGYWGQQTDYAYESYVYWLAHKTLPPLFRDAEETTPKTTASKVISSSTAWPGSNEADLRRYYGEPGTHLTYLILPYTHRLAWDTAAKVTRIQCHEKVHDSLERVLSRVLDCYGMEKIQELRLDLFGGCFNKRQMRGGSRWSLHSWAIALDYDPDHNRLEWKSDKAGFAKPEYEQWWKLWEEEGWTSLGRTKNYDWMHVQATH